MYSKMFELCHDEINSIIENTPENKLELHKIEIKGNKVKFVFLDKSIMKIKVMHYEFDWFNPKPKLLKFKREYVKPFNDKYFR